MSAREHLELLARGVSEWNANRPDAPDFRRARIHRANLRHVNLRDADLHEAKLRGADLFQADLSGANLTHVDLSGAHLFEADLRAADLRGANLRGATLIGADLSNANLRRASPYGADLRDAKVRDADLRDANLTGSRLTRSDLRGSDLRKTNLQGAHLHEVRLQGTDLTGAVFANTVITRVDLRGALGLPEVQHQAPSSVGVDTLLRSETAISQRFLRGCGMPNLFIEYSLDALRPAALEFHSAFISYSSTDSAFAERLHDDLFNTANIPCWLDQHQLSPGDDLDQAIHGAIRDTERILLVCSESSINSWWVDREVALGLGKEKDGYGHGGLRTPLIIPLDIDGYLFSDECNWTSAEDLKRRRVAKFAGWDADEDTYQQELARVVNALRASGPLKPFIPPPRPPTD